MANLAMDHGTVDHRFAAFGQALVILTELAILPKPRKGPLDDPPTRQQDERLLALRLRDDL